MEVLTKILQQGAEFNMLADSVLADRYEQLVQLVTMISDKGELPIAMALANVVTTSQMVGMDKVRPCEKGSHASILAKPEQKIRLQETCARFLCKLKIFRDYCTSFAFYALIHSFYSKRFEDSFEQLIISEYVLCRIMNFYSSTTLIK